MKICTVLITCGVSAIVLAITAFAQSPAPSRPEQGLIDDLVLANRMLASQESYGHVSVRSRRNNAAYNRGWEYWKQIVPTN